MQLHCRVIWFFSLQIALNQSLHFTFDILGHNSSVLLNFEVSLLFDLLIEFTGDNGPLNIARKTGLPLIKIQLNNQYSNLNIYEVKHNQCLQLTKFLDFLRFIISYLWAGMRWISGSSPTRKITSLFFSLPLDAFSLKTKEGIWSISTSFYVLIFSKRLNIIFKPFIVPDQFFAYGITFLGE